jgi:anti-anti-sigma factor
MAQVFRVADHYVDISGGVRDDFVADLVRLRDTTDEDLVLDFTGVEGMSSISLAAVGKLHTWLQENQRHLTIVGLSERLRRLFDITGLAEMLDIQEASEA